jgi:hypothetical protein
MAFELAQAAHVGVGSVSLALYWAALLQRKGSAPHKRAGRAFFITLLLVALSVGPLLLWRPGPFNPAYVVQFSYLSLCLLTVTILGWTAIRWKHDPERFRGWHFRILGFVLLLLGAVVLAAGLASGDPLPTVLSWVGLVVGSLMLRFAWLRAPLHPLWWLNWHISAICLLFTAVHGTFLFVVWRWAVAPEAGREVAAGFQLGVLAVAVAMRVVLGRRRGVPLRFAEPVPQQVRGIGSGAPTRG